MNKYIKLLIVLCLAIISCSEEENLLEDNSDDPNTIYASEAPYFFKANSDCNVNLSSLQNLINQASLDGKKLVIDKDDYCINGTLLIPSNIEIDFSGATIKRQTGTTQVFDMIKNNDSVNSNITLNNLIIDGMATMDNLDKINDDERFSGLKLDNCENIRLEDITVTGTVNAENGAPTPAAGIFILNSNNITCNRINGIKNTGTAIIFSNSEQVLVKESITHGNIGTGLAATKTNNSEFLNLNSYNNNDPYVNSEGTPRNYSNITINGLYNKVLNVETWGSDASGLNIGHNGNPSNYNTIDNIHSYNNDLEGITITDSKHILMSNIHLENNKRRNLLIHDSSTNIQINNALIYGTPDFGGNAPIGIYIKSGGRHSINNATIYDNYHGIYIENTSSPISIGSEVFIYNNGSAESTTNSGIKIVNSQLVSINNPKIFCDQLDENKKQNYGIAIYNSQNLFIRAKIWGNATKNYFTNGCDDLDDNPSNDCNYNIDVELY